MLSAYHPCVLAIPIFCMQSFHATHCVTVILIVTLAAQGALEAGQWSFFGALGSFGPWDPFYSLFPFTLQSQMVTSSQARRKERTGTCTSQSFPAYPLSSSNHLFSSGTSIVSSNGFKEKNNPPSSGLSARRMGSTHHLTKVSERKTCSLTKADLD